MDMEKIVSNIKDDTNTEVQPNNETILKFSCQNQSKYDYAVLTTAPDSLKTIECDNILINEMEYLSITEQNCTKLNNNNNNNNNNATNGDGNDSGVEAGATPLTGTGALQRALSNNSAGYASSSGGLDAPVASCNSSQYSVCSEQYDGKFSVNNLKHNMDCTSEGGSESSSLSGGPISCNKRQSTNKRRVGVTEPTRTFKDKKENIVAKCRSRAASANRAAVHAKTSTCASHPATTARARSREKKIESNTNDNGNRVLGRSASLRRPAKPDSLPNFKEYASPSLQRVASMSRTPSNTRRTPNGTPTADDGRWPFVKESVKRNGSSTPDNLVIKTKVGPIVLENRSAANTDKFATMPRRRKEKSEEDLRQSRLSRRDSLNRDRMVSSAVMKRVSSKESTPVKIHPPPIYPPKARKSLSKTLIYHEQSIQTAITSKDIDNAFAGIAKQIEIDAVSKCTKASQVDIRDKEIEKLVEQVRQMQIENATLEANLNERSQLLQLAEQQILREREEKDAMKKELQSNTERVLSMLEMVHAPPLPDSESNCDSLLMLESQIQLSEHALEAKQSEIEKLRSFCTELQTEMNRSLTVQRNLLEERQVFEKESSELQDFLQDEKTAIVEALKDAENDLEQCKTKLIQKETETERLKDECRHLVRISEQRRQEFLGMQSKYAALESKSKEIILQQNNTVSGATLALSDLGQRLNSLVEQLISSYNISEQDLEEVVYHNEVYANSSDEVSPESEMARATINCKSDGSLSPQRHESFIAAIIGAIKNAASSARETVNRKSNGDVIKMNDNEEESDVTEMLDSETEPCLMMENVLEDVSMPDSHSHNMVSSTNSLLLSSQYMGTNIAGGDIVMNKDEQTLHNLCEAIANRQQIEQQTNLMLMPRNHNLSERVGSDEGDSVHESVAEIPSISEYLINQSLVDQVINVDNLVTKLLKILRIVQMDNDNCLQQLISEKHLLQLNKEEMSEKLKEHEELNDKLQKEIGVAAEQLRKNGIELQRRRTEINKLNEDICNLSTLCSKGRSRYVTESDILCALKSLQERKEPMDPELIAYISTIYHENPAFHGKFISKDRPQTKTGLLVNGQNRISETKNQNDAMNRAIETVQEHPELVKLQRDLEQSKCAKNTLPVLIADPISSNSGLSSECNAKDSNIVKNSKENKQNYSIDLSA